jgi:hypothetical protein
MLLPLPPNDTLNPTRIIKLRIPPLNVLVNDPPVLLECEFSVVVNFVANELVADLLLLVDVLLTELCEDRVEEKLLN